jgi:hypothetical protein
MDFSLKLITPPSLEPVTAEEVKLHAHISHSVEDALIDMWIKSGRILAEDFQRRAYVGQIWEIAFDSLPELPIYIPRPPLIGIMTIKIYDTLGSETVLYDSIDNPITTTEEGGVEPSTNSDFIIDTKSEPGRLEFAYGKTWPSITPRKINACIIKFAAGCGLEADDVPENIKDAIILYCTARSENRAGESDFLDKFHDILGPSRNYQ